MHQLMSTLSKSSSIFRSMTSNMRFSAFSRSASNIDRLSGEASAPRYLRANNW